MCQWPGSKAGRTPTRKERRRDARRDINTPLVWSHKETKIALRFLACVVSKHTDELQCRPPIPNGMPTSACTQAAAFSQAVGFSCSATPATLVQTQQTRAKQSRALNNSMQCKNRATITIRSSTTDHYTRVFLLHSTWSTTRQT